MAYKYSKKGTPLTLVLKSINELQIEY